MKPEKSMPIPQFQVKLPKIEKGPIQTNLRLSKRKEYHLSNFQT